MPALPGDDLNQPNLLAEHTVGQRNRKLDRFLREIGLRVLIDSTFDIKILCFQRFVRMLAYAQTTLILTLYFTALGFSEERIGLFMTATLIGDVLISFVLTLFADALGRKRVLILGCMLMFGSGVVFAISDNFWILLLAAIAGVISPSGNEIGPFRAVEESTLAHLTPADERTDVFAWYSLLGRFGSAIGSATCGAMVQFLQDRANWSNVRSYRFVYLSYAAIALIKLYTSYILSEACELKGVAQSKDLDEISPDSDGIDEDAVLLRSTDELQEVLRDEIVIEEGGPTTQQPVLRGGWFKLRSYLPPMSRESRKTLLILMPLIGLDAFAQGLINDSWLTYYFTEKFGIKEASLGGMFTLGNLGASAGALLAASITRRIGIIPTMIVTHVPSSLILGVMPAISDFTLALVFFVLRQGTNMMDTAPRQVFISSVVLPEERTSTMGLSNVIRTFSTSIGPTITGILAEKHKMWVSFEISLAIKLMYNLGLVTFFWKKDWSRS
ncbi:major facilitator superfamily domain-containing protein [Lipomyces arxii]|uniref:major facilitator superfamily domain-containing protein n=1 Tax=Lipomyces arxii TaxID=56418 RepID=UPI0034CD3238